MRRGMWLPALALALSLAPAAARAGERLDRGLTGRVVDGGAVYLSWRLLPTDPEGTAFRVERVLARGESQPLTPEPVRATTDFVDRAPPVGHLLYTVTPVGGGEPARVEVVREDGPAPKAGPLRTIRIAGGQTFQKVGIADLDGDGRLDFVLKTPDDNVDPYEQYWKRSEGTYALVAVDADGRTLWTHDLGWAIERGIWYSPYVVADLDGDGKAEVALKTGDESTDPRDADGRVTGGPEFLTILEGATGKRLTQLAWPDRKPFLDASPGQPLRGYNFASRNQLAVARLDGKNPHLIVLRGTYNLMVAQAYRYEGGKLRTVWRWDNVGLGREYQGQGAHWTHAADVDNDGREEIVLGSIVLDDDGHPLWTTGLGHPDHAYVGDIDPDRPGLEIYYGIETAQKKNGMCLVDAATGRILWGHEQPTRHVHGQGLCSDVDATYPGSECYSADTDKDKKFAYARLRTAKGQVIGEQDLGGFAPDTVYWDADLQRELVRSRKILDLDGTAQPAPRIEGNLIATVDLLGDWREELVSTVPGELRIYATTIPARDRRVTLLADPIYRSDVTHAAMGYYQVPMTSYDLQATVKGR